MQAASDWLYVYPRGIYDLLLYIKRKYKDPVIYITENGKWHHSKPGMKKRRVLYFFLTIKDYPSGDKKMEIGGLTFT